MACNLCPAEPPRAVYEEPPSAVGWDTATSLHARDHDLDAIRPPIPASGSSSFEYRETAKLRTSGQRSAVTDR